MSPHPLRIIRGRSIRCPDCGRTVDDRHWYGHRWDVHRDAKTRDEVSRWAGLRP